MKAEDVVIGMKVVPHDKTVGYRTGLKNSPIWRGAKKLNQPFVYVTGSEDNIPFCNITSLCFVLDTNKTDDNGGDYFNASDFEPYEEQETVTINKDNFKKLLVDVWHDGMC